MMGSFLVTTQAGLSDLNNRAIVYSMGSGKAQPFYSDLAIS